MKKRLEAELISIAHRILKLKNKSEIDQLYKETQKLYETLAVLKFHQDNFESVKSDVPQEVLEEKLEQSNTVASVPAAEVEQELPVVAEQDPIIEEEAQPEDPKAGADPEPEKEEEPQPETEVEAEETKAEEETESEPESEKEQKPELEEIVEEAGKNVIQPEAVEEVAAVLGEEAAEEIIADDKPAFEPIFQLEVEEETVPEEKKVKLEDFLGDYKDPVFVKPDEVSLFPSETKSDEPKAEEPKKEETFKPAPVNEGTSKSIAIGLNDRIGFVNHLFNGSNEDFNRVLSQLNTFDTFDEAKTFINEMVIPDYNYWVGEEEYIERFMAIVEKKFQ